jgi:MSHA biogenesis protein MshK
MQVLVGLVLALMIAATLNAGELQDPTRPSFLSPGADAAAAGDTKTTPSLVLNAIRLSPTRRSAMINDRSIKVGERIGDARVVAIDRDGVRLQRGTEQFTLRLLPIRVKQAPKAARR